MNTPTRCMSQREDLAAARRAADLRDAALKQDADDFEAAWTLARARYRPGGRAAGDQFKRTARELPDAVW